MKFLYLKTLACLFFSFFLFSCFSVSINFKKNNQSWPVSNESGTKGTIKLIGVSADRSGGRDSLEREVAILAPLYFWTEGYKTVDSKNHADYAAVINLREREFADGWRTKRSLAIEVRIWDCVDGDIKPDEISGNLPLAAGRVVLNGNKSFSSSETTGKMLSGAISETLERLSSMRHGTTLPQRSASLSQR